MVPSALAGAALSLRGQGAGTSCHPSQLGTLTRFVRILVREFQSFDTNLAHKVTNVV